MAGRVTGRSRAPSPTARRRAPTQELAKSHLAEASEPLNLILIADADLLADHTWLRQQSLLGREILMPLANNGDLAINALENLRGSHELIGLRGRGLDVRPFEVVEAMAQDAEIRFRAKEQELLGRIKATQDKIEALQQEEQSSGVILTAEQQAEVDDFRAEMIGLRQELRGVQRSLRQDVESLATQVKLAQHLDRADPGRAVRDRPGPGAQNPGGEVRPRPRRRRGARRMRERCHDAKSSPRSSPWSP